MQHNMFSRFVRILIVLAFVLAFSAIVVTAQGTPTPPDGWCNGGVSWIVDGFTQEISQLPNPCPDPVLVDLVQLHTPNTGAEYGSGEGFGVDGKLQRLSWAVATPILAQYNGGSIWHVGTDESQMVTAQVVDASELICDIHAGDRVKVQIGGTESITIRQSRSTSSSVLGSVESGVRFIAPSDSVVENGFCWVEYENEEVTGFVAATLDTNRQVIIADPFLIGEDSISYAGVELVTDLPVFLQEVVEDDTMVIVFEPWTAGCSGIPTSNLCNVGLSLLMPFSEFETFVREGAVGVTVDDALVDNNGLMWENGSIKLVRSQTVTVTADTVATVVDATTRYSFSEGTEINVIGYLASDNTKLVAMQGDEFVLADLEDTDANVELLALNAITFYEPTNRVAEVTPEVAPPATPTPVGEG